ncbi:unnamed protein product [Rotaria sordida]|uniref:Ubiquitin carboxyl-terminal hydrolase n=1 Tax=Rotaria sordida TaxID=392033 RepID=A0A813YJ02_9BILA|nr:unnamed protein product [Rotaria sordida]CAF3680501.1 unnamed protein product [Rotaria sordida]
MDRTDYIYLNINSLSTLGKLRKQAYEKFNKLAKNQPIYRWNKDSWMQFESELDEKTLDDLDFESSTFISIDYDDKEINSKHPSSLCGLVNLGSTCFMNSVFQCLNNIPEFIIKILELNDEINAPIISEYKKLVKKMWSGKYNTINPSSLLDNIQDNLPHYSSYRQQDAQEFMNHFLHLIHAEFSMKTTLITELFYGQLQSTVKCLGCQQTEITNEPFTFLPLSMMNSNQKSVLYVKTDGEQRLVSIKVNSSIFFLKDLIDCFIKQHEPTLTSERIHAVQLVDNVITDLYDTRQSLRNIREEELAFVERPEKTDNEKYIKCQFVDYSTNELFRPSILLICPNQNCSYLHLSEQIDQLLGHLCSMTNAPGSAFQLFWRDRQEKTFKLNVETNRNENLPYISAIRITMATKWVDIYRKHCIINHSTDNSMLAKLLANFFREDYLDGDYHCLKCSKRTVAQHKSYLCLPLPHVLIIQLKRFIYDTNSNEKIDTYIRFPLYELDLNEYTVKDDNNNNKLENSSSTKYDLIAVANHTGSLLSGHYTTYAKNNEDKNWYLFDDQYVRKLNSDKDIVTKNAYILVYVQKNLIIKYNK